ncbi:AAA family ATPase [Sorangium sp. So ce362]|uniref:AAA family ATPase n=1 Tax=Sorangium sp. So ce362 TaxID=3133303 RepID=UPI003F5E1170
MLRSLHLEGVGPADQLDLELGERLNLLTGDNGLGKSFVLEVAWWALTGTWTDRPVLPRPGKEESARIAGDAEPGTRSGQFESKYERVAQQWRDRFDRDMSVGLVSTPADIDVPSWVQDTAPVLYIRTNGAYSVWDPHRQSLPTNSPKFYPLVRLALNPVPYLFEENQIWNGLRRDDKPFCNGLVQDWVTWQLEAAGGDENHPFHLLCRVLDQLSHPEEKMTPGKPVRLYLDDVRKFPTIELPYGTIPIVHASAGMKRILELSYLIAWSWSEHVQASRLIGWQPSDRIVLLVEEPETHLHPRWQRHIVPALLGVLGGLSPSMRPQVLLTTHSPLVLASMEPHFKPARDKLFVFELDGADVTVRELPWTKRGDAIGWLTSPVFGLEQARSIEAECAVEAAEAFMRGETGALPEGLRNEDDIHRELVRLLPDQDRFWPRWIVRRDRAGA